MNLGLEQTHRQNQGAMDMHPKLKQTQDHDY